MTNPNFEKQLQQLIDKAKDSETIGEFQMTQKLIAQLRATSKQVEDCNSVENDKNSREPYKLNPYLILFASGIIAFLNTAGGPGGLNLYNYSNPKAENKEQISKSNKKLPERIIKASEAKHNKEKI